LQTLRSFTAPQAAEYFLPRRRDSRRHAKLERNLEGLWPDAVCQSFQCTDCRFAFPVPYVAGDPEFYDLAYGIPSYPRHRWEYDRAVHFLRPLCLSSAPRRILELGAGDGRFIQMLLRDSVCTPEQIVATDYSPHSVRALGRLGVDARLSSVLSLASGRGDEPSFDAACAFQSIEHMARVIEVILAVKHMTKPGGLIILSVPHGPAVEFSERRLGCFDMPPNHVGRWYRDTFVALAGRVGLELVAHEVEPRNLRRWLMSAVELRVRGIAGASPRSFAARVRAIENTAIRRALSAVAGAAALLPLLPAVLRMKSGFSQLAVLRLPPN
jgi:SAM-dependent methyltransferase